MGNLLVAAILLGVIAVSVLGRVAIVRWVGPLAVSMPTIVRDVSDEAMALPPDVGPQADELARLGFERIGQVELAWARIYQPRQPSRTWKSASAEPAISGGIRAGTGTVTFWTVWPDGSSLTTTYPDLRKAAVKDLQIQGTNDGIEAAYRLHQTTLAEMAKPNPLDLRTAQAVMAGDRLEIARATEPARQPIRWRTAFLIVGIELVVVMAMLAIVPARNPVSLLGGLLIVATPIVAKDLRWRRWRRHQQLESRECSMLFPNVGSDRTAARLRRLGT
ncbi:MAG TPA: hypothetical protein VF293_02615 [Candidatus Limnocylindrales bacterium]